MFKIETPRCFITAWENSSEEREVLHRWTTDAEMMRYITGSAWSDTDRERFFERHRLNMEKAGVCFGAVRLKSSSEIIGIAGAQPLELVDDWHLGWWVDRGHQGEGMATELAQAVLDHVLHVVRRPHAVAIVKPENLASRRVAEKVGMKYVKTVRANTLESRWKDEDMAIYSS